MDRKQLLLNGVSKNARIVEVGPSFAPIAAKAEGWNAFTIDHADRAGLVAKYESDPAVDTSRIEEVDFVWTGGPVSGAVPSEQHGTFDAFIASHVIEHTTDVVEFLHSAEALLKDDGLVILAVPDKRKCFDIFRPISTTGAAIAARSENKTKHSLETHVDHLIYHARKSESPGWSITDTARQRLGYSIDIAHDAYHWAAEPGYIDAHQWVFVPSSLALMVLELSAIGLLNLRVQRVQEAEYTEFFVWLRKGREELSPEALASSRLALMSRIVVELAEQSRQVPDSPLLAAERRVVELEAQLRGRGLRQVIRERIRQMFGV